MPMLRDLHGHRRLDLVAPITLVDFDFLQEQVEKLAQIFISSQWEEKSVGELTQNFVDKDASLKYNKALKTIEASCRELVPGFSLGIHSPWEPTEIRVDKMKLETAKNILCGPVLSPIKKTDIITGCKSTLFVESEESKLVKDSDKLVFAGAPGGPSFVSDKL